MEVVTFEKVETVRYERKFEHIVLAPNLNVARRTIRTVKESGTVISNSLTQGFCTDSVMAKLKLGKGEFAKHIAVLNAERREHIRRFGRFHRPSAETKSPKGVFEQFEDGEATLEDLVYGGDEGLYRDYQGRLLPMGQRADYIDAAMHNGRYDLKKLAEILLAREDVFVCKRKHSWSDEMADEPAETVKEAILTIPGYNAEDDKTHFIEFRWMPSQEDFEKVVAQAQSGKKGYIGQMEMWKAIFDLDLLGTRVANYQQGNFYGQPVDRPGYGDDRARPEYEYD